RRCRLARQRLPRRADRAPDDAAAADAVTALATAAPLITPSAPAAGTGATAPDPDESALPEA
ncbi:hypothetical protein, partial [Microbacterium sp. K41]|uniref:hypothetical protein n=1 Tax=Microbacterium sp. K41 TaxID=2305437 RepID=UPI00197B8C85